MTPSMRSWQPENREMAVMREAQPGTVREAENHSAITMRTPMAPQAQRRRPRIEATRRGMMLKLKNMFIQRRTRRRRV